MDMLSIKPLSSEDYYQQGLTYVWHGLLKRALTAFSEAIVLDNRNVMALFARGVLLGQINQPYAAIDDLTVVIELTPNHSRAHYLRGVAYKQIGAAGLAIDDFTRTLACDPTCDDAYLQRADLRARDGLASLERAPLLQAQEDYTMALLLNPGIIGAYKNRGLVRAAAGDVRGAVADFRHYLAQGGGRHNGDQRDIEALIDGLQAG